MKNKHTPSPETEIPLDICPRCREKANRYQVNPGEWGYYCPRCGHKWLILPDSEIEKMNEIDDSED